MSKLYTSPLGCPSYFLPLGDSLYDPFRDDEPVASFTRETSANSSQILKVLKPSSQDFSSWYLPLSRFRDEFASPRMALAAFPQWYEDSCLSLLDDFRSTTSLNSSPLLVGRHVIRMTPSQARFSLSVAFASASEPVIPPKFGNPRTWVF